LGVVKKILAIPISSVKKNMKGFSDRTKPTVQVILGGQTIRKRISAMGLAIQSSRR
jgi:hypothetical protein